MLSINLDNLKFHAYHGIHEEETILGNDFEVNAKVTWEESSEKITTIGETINYVLLYDIIAKRMAQPAHLLETLAMEIGRSFFTAFPFLCHISVQVKKLHAGIPGLDGSLGVTWSKNFR